MMEIRINRRGCREPLKPETAQALGELFRLAYNHMAGEQLNEPIAAGYNPEVMAKLQLVPRDPATGDYILPTTSHNPRRVSGASPPDGGRRTGKTKRR